MLLPNLWTTFLFLKGLMETHKLSVPLRQFEKAEHVLAQPTNEPPASLPVQNPTQSFWLNSSPDANPLASEGSTGELTKLADVCIIGSGITGVSFAYHFANRLAQLKDIKPMSAVILEARDFCSGATGRNGGHLTPFTFAGFVSNQARYGVAETLKGYALEEHTAYQISKFIKKHNLEEAVDLVAGGHHSLFFTEEEQAEIQADFKAAQAAGMDLDNVKWWTKSEMKTRTGAIYPAVEIPGHNLWPVKLVNNLYLIAKNKTSNLSLTLHTRTPVTAISESNQLRWRLTTPRGDVHCSYIIHATNAYTSKLLPHLRGPSGIIPTRGQVMALRANASLTELTKSSWDGNDGFEYWFPRPLPKNASSDDHPLVILGGGREVAGSFEYYQTDDSTVNTNVGRALRDFLPGAFPGKYEKGREPEMEWTGIMAYTKMRDPFVGPVIVRSERLPGQYISAGYNGHGMPRAYACAEAVAGMITANILDESWEAPEWLPERYLTWNRDPETGLLSDKYRSL